MGVVSVCGLFNCGGCDYRANGRCLGCAAGNEKLMAEGAAPCRIYLCAAENGVATCPDCTRPLCDIPRRIDDACPLRSPYQKKRWWASRLTSHFERLNRERRVDKSVNRISPKTVDRMRLYLLVLQEMEDEGAESVSSREIAAKVGINAALVRKDLSHFGDFGTPNYGYLVSKLIRGIRAILHLDEPHRVVWVGAQRLAANQDLLLELQSHNCRIVLVLDVDETRIGGRVAGLRVEPLERIRSRAKDLKIHSGVIATSAQDAQRATDALLAVGVKALLNLTSVVLSKPPEIVVRNANVVSEMMALSFYSAYEGTTEMDGE